MRLLITTKYYVTRSGEGRIRAVAGPHRRSFSYCGTMAGVPDTDRNDDNAHKFCAQEILAQSGWGTELTEAGVLNDGTYVWFYK